MKNKHASQLDECDHNECDHTCQLKTKYIIRDWAGNVLDFKGTFKLPELAVAMKFESFEDGNDWILEHMREADHSDVFVEEADNNILESNGGFSALELCLYLTSGCYIPLILLYLLALIK